MTFKWILLAAYLFCITGNAFIHKPHKIPLFQHDTMPQPAVMVQYVIKIIDPSLPPDSKPVWTVPAKIWYVDSVAIEENASLRIMTDAKNNTTTSIDIKNYRFVDLRKRSIYVYNSLSDTAALVKKYSFDDKSVETPGGWQFNTKKDSDYIGEPERIADTTIAGVNYSRVKLRRKWNDLIYFSTLFFSCESPTSIFTFYPQLSEKMGCSSVKFLTEYPDHGKYSMLMEIYFVRNELSQDEIKVFDAWASNAAKYPVR